MLGKRRPLQTVPALLAGLLFVSGCETGGPGWTPGRGRPEEDVWAIRCVTLPGAGGAQRAKQYAEAIKRVGGLNPELVQVLTTEDGTAVFYGRYRRIYGTAEAEQRYRPSPQRDMETIRSLRFEDSNVWPFILATMDVLPTYSSTRPEWNLDNVEGYWTLHVAVFYNTDGFRSRRAAAEEYCRYLREERKEEAYYHHGAVNSSVYVGLFAREAVVNVRRENPMAGRVTTSMQVVDRQMQETQKRFPYSLHNGHMRYDIQRDPMTGEISDRVPTPSFAVRTPRGQRLYERYGED